MTDDPKDGIPQTVPTQSAIFSNAANAEKIIDARRIKHIVAGFEFLCRIDQLLQQIPVDAVLNAVLFQAQ